MLLRAQGGHLLGNGTLIGIWELTGGGPFRPAWALVPTTGMFVWHAGVTWPVAAWRARTRSASRP